MLENITPGSAERESHLDIGRFLQEETEASSVDSDPESLSISRSIPLEQKLRLSHLNKDEKENLKALRPAIEITSPDALKAFEVQTFSGSPRDAEGGSHPAKKEVASFGETTKPAAGVSQKKPYPETSKAKKFSFVVTIRSSMAMVKPWLETGRKFVIYAAVLSLVVVGLWIAGRKLMTPSQPWRGNLKQEQRIFLQFLGEASQQQLLTLTTAMKDPTVTPNLAEVEQLFSREFKRYTGLSTKPIQFELSNYPISMFDGLTKQHNVSQLLTTNLIFGFLKQKGAEATSNYDATVYIYYYPFDPEHINLGFPDEFAGEHLTREGVIFAPAHLSQRLRVLASLARETAKIYGATDKVDPVTHMPLLPGGFAAPKEKSIYPQKKAELMGKDIPISPIQKRSILSLSEVVIGPDTALELGWINRMTRDRLLQ